MLSRAKISARTEAACQWMERHLRIIDKGGRLIPLRPNVEQQRLLWWVFAQREAGVPVRIIVLKDRKIGISTIIEAYGFMLLHMVDNLRGLVCAHDEDSSRVLFRMTQIFYVECPEQKPIESTRPTRKEIRWKAPHRSLFDVQTAGKLALGRGDTLQFLHASEVPYWRNAKLTLGSVLNAVPDHGDNAAFLEATGNGVEEFCSRWRSAVQYRSLRPKSLEGYIPLFFSWLEHDEYSLAISEPLGLLDEDEEFLVRLGATPEQLNWRRYIIEDKCNGDVLLFAQEYPATPSQSFQATGRRAIPGSVVARHKQTARPGERVVLRWDGFGDLQVEQWSGMGPYWEVWQRPDEVTDFAIGSDVAEGKLSDQADPRSKADYSAVFVLNRRNLTQAAQWHGRIEADLLGEEIWKAYNWYGEPWTSPEINSAGQAPLQVLRRHGCTNLYRTEVPDDRVEGGVTITYGWRTTNGNRHFMISDWISHTRPSAVEGFSGKIEVYSALLADEEDSFEVNKQGKPEHRTGYHDDMLFAAMIALQIHLRSPRQIRRIGPIPFVDYAPQKPSASWVGEVGRLPSEVGEPAMARTG